jgi:hypothetical protein
MTDKSSVDGQKKNKDSQLANVDFEVLMEFQRQVIKKYGSGRVSWFLSAIDRFIKDVKKNSGPIPPEDDHVNDSETDLLDDIDDDE